MSIVLIGSTSGSCTLQEQAIAGSSVITLPVGTGTAVVNGVNGSIVSGTSVASTSGTSIDFTGIPSWVKRITVMFSGVSTNGTSIVQVQLGVSGTPETSGYGAIAATIFNTNNTTRGTTSSTGFPLFYTGAATATYSGAISISLLGSNIWTCQGATYNPDSSAGTFTTGSKTLAGVLNMVRITTVNGTDAFDAGTINILYE